jgi:hypothetical protein
MWGQNTETVTEMSTRNLPGGKGQPVRKVYLLTAGNQNLPGQINSSKTLGQQTTQEGSFQEVRRQKRHATNETDGISKKTAVQT